MNLVMIVLLLPVASYRLTRLITKDTFPPILWMRDRLVGGWRPLTEPEWDRVRKEEITATQEIKGVMNRYIVRSSRSSYWLAELLSCPWCASAYVSAGLTAYGACLDWYTWPVALVVWLYTWGVAAMIASKEWA